MTVKSATQFKAGDRVSSWTLVTRKPGTKAKEPRTHARWVCRCTCGEEREVREDYLRHGLSKSCGHGLRSWRLHL